MRQTPNQVKKEETAKIKLKDENIVLPPNTNLNLINNVYTLQGKRTCIKNREKLLEIYNLPKNNKWKEYKESYYSLYEYTGLGREKYFGYTDIGEISYLEDYGKECKDGYETVSIYPNNKDNNLPVGMSVEEIKDLIESKYEKVRLHDYYDVDLETIAIKKIDNRTVLDVDCLMSYKGVPFSSYTYLYNKKNHVCAGELSYYTLRIDENKNVLSQVISDKFEITKSEKQKKVVSLESAANIVSNKLSGFKKVRISEIRAEYVISEIEGLNGVFQARPVYNFRVRSTRKDEKADDAYFNLRVDMVNGKLTDDMGMNGLKIAE